MLLFKGHSGKNNNERSCILAFTVPDFSNFFRAYKCFFFYSTLPIGRAAAAAKKNTKGTLFFHLQYPFFDRKIQPKETWKPTAAAFCRCCCLFTYLS